jgi:membrane protein YqaA with SNARE-associated domain
MNHYLNVLIESLWVASVIPGGSEPTFFSMKAFGGFSLPLACAIAVIGATIGQLFNWWLGKQIHKLQRKQQKGFNPAMYEKIQASFHKYGIFILLLSWLPILNLFVVAAGMLQVPLRTALPLIIAGQVAAYGFYLL